MRLGTLKLTKPSTITLPLGFKANIVYGRTPLSPLPVTHDLNPCLLEQVQEHDEFIVVPNIIDQIVTTNKLSQLFEEFD
jgi:hypothetical protein